MDTISIPLNVRMKINGSLQKLKSFGEVTISAKSRTPRFIMMAYAAIRFAWLAIKEFPK